jgi:diguanylate cyclase (GGDEF)-like protein/PAS domain S-box-containing protein
MSKKPTIQQQLLAENQELRARLEQAEATLREMLSGEADALFISDVGGAQLFTLKGADQSYRKLIENMSEGALTLTPEGLVLYANRRFAEMLRMPLGKVIGSDIHNWIASESRQVLRALLRKDAVDNHREELALAAADGTLVPVYLSVSRLVLDEIDSVCMVVTDLTEQKRNEAILANEKLSNAILEQAADAIVICDKNGRIMRASKQAQAFYNKSPLGQLFEQAIPLRQLDGTAFFPVGTIDTNRRLSAEARLKRNGHEFDLLVSVGHLKGARDELLGSVVTLTDITERKQAEEALLKNAERLRIGLNAANIAVFNQDLDLRYTWMYQPQLGYSSDQVVGKTDADLLPAQDAPSIMEIKRRVIETGKPERAEVPIHTDNQVIYFDLTIEPFLDKEGAIIGITGSSHNITGRKQADIDLHWRTTFFEALVNTSADGILVVDAQGKKVLQNQRVADLLNIPEDIAANPDDNPQLQFVINEVVDAKQFGDKVHYLYAHPEETSLDEVALKNGTILERYSAPVLDSDGHSYGRIWTFHDITKRKQSEQAQRTSEERFKTMFVQAPLGIALIDSLTGRIYEVNTRFADIAGRSLEEMLNIGWLQITHPDDVQADLDNMALMNAGKLNGYQMEKRYLHPDGKAVWIDMTITPLNVEDKTNPCHLCMIQDITERKQSEASIKYLNRVLSVLSGINSLIVRVNDLEELYREACNIAVENGGFRMAMVCIVDRHTMKIVPIASAGKDEELVGMIKDLLSSSLDVSNTMVGLAIGGRQPIVSNDSMNDSRVVFGKKYAESGIRSLVVLPLIVSGEAIGTISLYASEIDFFREEELKLLIELAGDIAYAIDHIAKQERLNYLAYYDVLTGLANRTLFLERVAQYMRSADSGGHKLAIGLIDLERFKNINDSLGRSAGDSLLKQVAERLTQFARDANLLARIDADHFAFVVPEVKSDGNLAKLVENLMVAFLEHSFHLNDSLFRIGIKVGIALFPDDGNDAEILFKNAEAALNKAKAIGDRFLFYKMEMNEAVAGKLAMENQLRQAIDKEEFVLHYQPKVNLVSGKVTGAEALIRWNDPRTGLVPPGMFIPILEETSLIYEVGRWALHKAMSDYLRWRAKGLPAVRIAVNVSPLQLRNSNFIDEIRRVVSLDGHAADGLELEITESLIMENVKLSITSLQAIRDLGVTIAIDDFGTGFSSLSYLAKLPVDTLKIDRAFVIEMDNPEGMALVSTIIILAHALKLKVVAEGVETEQQSRQLLSLNCDEMQGFLFSKPVPAEIFEARFLAPLPLGEK